MDVPANGRTVKPDGKKIRDMRLEKGWTTADLARHAKCSIKTIESVEKGKSVYRATLARIAKDGLQCKYSDLLGDQKDYLRAKRTKVFVSIKMDFQDFDETQLRGILEQIKQIAALTSNIEVLGVEDGTVTVILRMSHEDAIKLCEAVREGQLDDFDISGAGIIGYYPLDLEADLPDEKQAPPKKGAKAEAD